MDPIISTFNDLYKTGSDEVLLRNPKLTAREAGSVNDAYIGAGAAIGDEILVRALRKIAATYIDNAEGEDLDDLAWDHFGLLRQDAVQSVGTLLLSRPNDAAGAGQIPIGSRFTTNPGGTSEVVEFETTETKSLTGLSVSIAAKAVLGGTGGNVAASTITVVKSTLFDGSITVNNPDKFAGGVDREEDPAFRDRIKGYLETLRRATPGAIVYGAKAMGVVVFANLDESTAAQGYITLYVADIDGNANAELIAQVQAEMLNWRAAGVTLNVSGAVAVTQALTFALTYDTGVDTEAVKQKAIDAAKAYRDTLDVGKVLYVSQLYKAIQSIPGIKGVSITVPAGNVAPDPDEIIRGGTITVT